MNIHQNVKLTPQSRADVVRRVLDEGRVAWPAHGLVPTMEMQAHRHAGGLDWAVSVSQDVGVDARATRTACPRRASVVQ